MRHWSSPHSRESWKGISASWCSTVCDPPVWTTARGTSRNRPNPKGRARGVPARWDAGRGGQSAGDGGRVRVVRCDGASGHPGASLSHHGAGRLVLRQSPSRPSVARRGCSRRIDCRCKILDLAWKGLMNADSLLLTGAHEEGGPLQPLGQACSFASGIRGYPCASSQQSC